MPPLLSIIVPTKNRSTYCVSAVEALLEFAPNDLEVVVSDNGDDDSLEGALREAAVLSRITYRRWPEHLEICEHFERAFDLSTGRYVAFIGDDDGISQELIRAVRALDRDGRDALVSSVNVGYWWPDVTPRVVDRAHRGLLMLDEWSGRVEEKAARDELELALRKGGTSLCHLPRSYQGVVRRDHLETVRARHGVMFAGPSPDMSGAVAVALLDVTVRVVDLPLFIAGAAAGSGGGRGAARQHEGELKRERHLSRDVIEGWSDLVPSFFSGPTIWAEGLVRTLTRMKRADALTRYNMPYMIATCLLFTRSTRSRAWHFFVDDLKRRRAPVGALGSLARLALSTIDLMAQRVQSLWLRVGSRWHLSSRSRFTGVSTIFAATRLLNDRLDRWRAAPNTV